MQPPSTDPDPYAELDNRADASELSEEYRKPIRILQAVRCDLRVTRSGLGRSLRNRL